MKNTSFSSMAFLFLVHLLLLISSVMAQKRNENLILSTCKNTPNTALCVSTLKSNPKSYSADVAGLGYIIVNVVKVKSTVVLESITRHADYNQKLGRCVKAYKFVLGDLIPGVLTAPPKFAVDNMNSVAEEAKKCAAILPRNNLPASANNKLVQDLSGVAASILKMLL